MSGQGGLRVIEMEAMDHSGSCVVAAGAVGLDATATSVAPFVADMDDVPRDLRAPAGTSGCAGVGPVVRYRTPPAVASGGAPLVGSAGVARVDRRRDFRDKPKYLGSPFVPGTRRGLSGGSVSALHPSRRSGWQRMDTSAAHPRGTHELFLRQPLRQGGTCDERIGSGADRRNANAGVEDRCAAEGTAGAGTGGGLRGCAYVAAAPLYRRQHRLVACDADAFPLFELWSVLAPF